VGLGAGLGYPLSIEKNLAGGNHARSLFCRPRHRRRSRAAKSFGVTKAWRFWSLADPAVHQATYQFTDEAALDRAMKGEDLKRLVADFNRDWPDVTRTRETFVLAEEFVA
jgi:hypothetical protein